jgi:MoaA/NifB/PqqE/SkfB family radical SAM enzyme
MNLNAFLNTLGTRCRTLPLVILYVTEGCNLRCVTCSYRTPLPNELSLEEISRLAVRLKELGLRHIVYSGGEPLTRKDLPDICRVFRNLGVKQSLLTNGLLLEKRLADIESFFSEIIVSVDGPDEGVHDGIRGVTSFKQITRGIRAVREGRKTGQAPVISLRTVIQKKNFRSVIAMVRFGRELGVDRMSFLAADVLSDGFGRTGTGPALRNDDVVLSPDETGEFRQLIETMASECAGEFASGFIAESPRKMRALAEYFEALQGMGPFPETQCNAPMVSAVITSTGDIKPCFFLPAFAALRDGNLRESLNGPGIRSVRSDVRNGNLDRCKTCVCTLHVSPAHALLDRFT